METASPTTSRPAPKIIFVVSLLVAVFAATVIDVVIPINTLDIAHTFNILPGTVGQLDSIIAIASVATALLLAGFGARYRYKSMVITGVLLIVVYNLGLFLSPTFLIVQLIVPLNGIGSVLIVVTAQTFIGNSYPLDKKAKAIGWVAATGALAMAVGSPAIGFITGIGGWRSVSIWLMLPVSVASLIFVFLVFPSNSTEPQRHAKKEPFMTGLKQVLTSKSAVACLTAAFLGNAFVFGGMIFQVTFLREIFASSPGIAASVGPMAGTTIISVGAIIGGHVVNRVGRKHLTVVALFFSGLLVMISYFMQNLSSFLALHWTASIFMGITMASASNLMLEQVPRFRGTAMSLDSAFSGVGKAMGVMVSGAVLNLSVNPILGFQALGLIVGGLAFAGAVSYLLFARDPLKPGVSNKNT
jgi:DHA1 family inner membrane transport protein